MASSSSNPGNVSEEISTCNISDAMDRKGSLGPFLSINPPARTIYGKAVTCETNNGDWWAVVKAIDSANRGDIIVAASLNGKDKAIMGELLATSARDRGVLAMVLDGSVRDIPELHDLGLPVYARHFVPNASDPKGEGKVGLGIEINGVTIRPGDLIACDGSGVVAVPASRSDEIMERAKAVVNKEKKIRKQIGEGKTLSDILNF